MRFLAGLVIVTVLIAVLLFADSCGDPFMPEERLALWELYVYVAGFAFLIWILVQVAKEPNKGIPVTVVEDKRDEGENQSLAKKVASVSGNGTQTKTLELPEGLYSVDLSVENESEDNFIVNLHAMSDERESPLALEIAKRWKGSKALRVGEIDHPPGGQLLGVESSGSWTVTFTRH